MWRISGVTADGAASATYDASSATVGRARNVVSGTWTPRVCPILAQILAAARECPPRSRKWSWTPTRSAPSTSAVMAASRCSVSPRGATYSVPAAPMVAEAVESRMEENVTAGSRERSAFPVGPTGMVSRNTILEGIM